VCFCADFLQLFVPFLRDAPHRDAKSASICEETLTKSLLLSDCIHALEINSVYLHSFAPLSAAFLNTPHSRLVARLELRKTLFLSNCLHTLVLCQRIT
jgi:hypothetical protein